jgi:hypothetical protein
VTLEGLEKDTLVRQTVSTFPLGESPSEKVFEYRSLNRATSCFEAGAFSQGSMQWSPFAEFGAELGLVAGDLSRIDSDPRPDPRSSLSAPKHELDGA